MTVPAPADTAKVPLLDVAYHHEPYWRPDEGDWIKSLLLFFDGIAILVPDYMRDRPLFTDPSLAQPLADLGLLHRLSPETLVDQQTAEALTELLDDLLRTDAFDDLDRDTAFAEISHSRLGGTADAGGRQPACGVRLRSVDGRQFRAAVTGGRARAPVRFDGVDARGGRGKQRAASGSGLVCRAAGGRVSSRHGISAKPWRCVRCGGGTGVAVGGLGTPRRAQFLTGTT